MTGDLLGWHPGQPGQVELPAGWAPGPGNFGIFQNTQAVPFGRTNLGCEPWARSGTIGA